MLQIQCQTVIPTLGREFLERMSLIVTSVVDQDADGSDYNRDFGQYGLICLDIADIAMPLMWSVSARTQARHQRTAGSLIDIAERNLGTLRRKMFNQRCADARGTAGNEHDTLCKTGILGHAIAFRLRNRQS